MSDHCPLSVLIPVKDEAENIQPCLASCAFAQEIVVIDSGSTDGTRAIAEQHGATVVDFRWNQQLPKKKNWALMHYPWKHEWIFILDADERITPPLADELRRVLAAPDADGYYVNRRFWFLDGWLNHCGYFPSWNLRFFRHRLGRYEQYVELGDTGSGDNEVHEHVILQGKTSYLRGEMAHYAFPSIATWVDKHNRYSNWEARMLDTPSSVTRVAARRLAPELGRKRILKGVARHLPFRPTTRFLYHYVLRRGFLDGYRGYVFCRLMAFYEFLSAAKARELRRTNSRSH